MAKIYDDITEDHRQHAPGQTQPHRQKQGVGRRCGRETRILQSPVQRQGPHRRCHDRGRRKAGHDRTQDTVIIEPTSGNTGIALAFVARPRGVPADPDHAGNHERGAAASCSQILGRNSCSPPGAEGMNGARSPRPRNWPRTDPQQSSFPSSSTIRPIRRSTAKPRPRKSGATPTARSISLWPASAPAAPSPASPK